METEIDNSAESTTDSGNNLAKATEFFCDDTKDRIFLLSEKQVTTSGYGFGSYRLTGEVSGRIRMRTDYAKATGASKEKKR